MTRQTLNRIIDAGQPVTISTELINAARERAHCERSAAIHSGIRWFRGKVRAIASRQKHRFDSSQANQSLAAIPSR